MLVKISLLLVFSLFFAGINCQQFVLAALYNGSSCGSIALAAYIPVGVCISNSAINANILISANGNSGSVALYPFSIIPACVTASANLSFNIGNCFAFSPTQQATVFSSSTPLWQIANIAVNSATNCNSPQIFAASLQPVLGGACAASGCVCSSVGACATTSCQTSTPSNPGGFSATTYNDSACSNPIGIGSVNTGGCLVYVNATGGAAQTSGTISCSGNTQTGTTYVGSTTCTAGTGVTVTTSNTTGGCTKALNNLYYQISCGAVCFHKDTEILYKDEKMTLDSLKRGEHPSCTVPHIYTSAGVKLITSCNNSTLRLSVEHLVYTQRGLLEAQAVKVGDQLFQDLEETRTCQVLSVEKEDSLSESYFGLNCEESIVLADGFKTSTFGKLHFVPSLWMRIMTPLIGVRAASSWGDYFSHLVQRYKLF